MLLVVQNASFTWVSRARNSGSDWYHAFAAVFSNGVWFAAFFFTFEGITLIREAGDTGLAVTLGLIYVIATVTGSVSSGMFLRKFVEKGKRRVGHYEKLNESLMSLATNVRILMEANTPEKLRELDERLMQFEVDAGPTEPMEEIDFEGERATARVLTGPGSAIYRIVGPEAAAEARGLAMRNIDAQEAQVGLQETPAASALRRVLDENPEAVQELGRRVSPDLQEYVREREERETRFQGGGCVGD
jgi:hypothetical protein